MFRADIAQRVLAQLKDKLAQAASVQERAALVPVEDKMRLRLHGYGASQPLPKRPPKRTVAFEGVGIYIYLPTDAAAVAAFVRNAPEIVIILRANVLHALHLICTIA